MIPSFEELMLPMLRLMSDRKEYHIQELVSLMAQHVNLSVEEQSELLPSGNEPVFTNRVRWAAGYLTYAAILNRPKRGYYVFTDRAEQVLSSKPASLGVKILEQFPEFRDFRNKTKKKDQERGPETASEGAQGTPEELIEASIEGINEQLAVEVLNAIQKQSAGFFERLVVDLLLKMDYGGSRKDAGEAIGKSGDGGIDGIIREDRLGLDNVYIQAKKWQEGSSVGRPEIQKFVGALMGRKATKGVFITTSHFTDEAMNYVDTIDRKVILIDGDELARLMIEHNVGVKTVALHEIKSVDFDYFDSE